MKDAFTIDPADQALRERLAGEGAGVWVLNGTGEHEPRLQARRLPRVPRPGGLGAAPEARGRGPGRRRSITVYNGAETEMPETIAYLEKLFGVTVKTATDPTVRDGRRHRDRA